MAKDPGPVMLNVVPLNDRVPLLSNTELLSIVNVVPVLVVVKLVVPGFVNLPLRTIRMLPTDLSVTDPEIKVSVFIVRMFQPAKQLMYWM